MSQCSYWKLKLECKLDIKQKDFKMCIWNINKYINGNFHAVFASHTSFWHSQVSDRALSHPFSHQSLFKIYLEGYNSEEKSLLYMLGISLWSGKPGRSSMGAGWWKWQKRRTRAFPHSCNEFFYNQIVIIQSYQQCKHEIKTDWLLHL